MDLAKDKCTGCSACYSICARNAIEMSGDQEGFYKPRVDTGACIQCGLCKKICPVKRENTYKPINEQI